MQSRRRSRRGFLKHGAAFAGVALAGVPSASGQTQDSPTSETPQKKLKELIAYGERSRYVTSIRVPVTECMSPDMFGPTFSRVDAAAGPVRDHHAVVVVL
jgi:hypothetical protein